MNPEVLYVWKKFLIAKEIKDLAEPVRFEAQKFTWDDDMPKSILTRYTPRITQEQLDIL